MSLFFDSSALISLAVTCSLPILRKLKEYYNGDFLITTSVYKETIERAMYSLRFRYEGYRLKELLDDSVLKIYSDIKLHDQIIKLMNTINKTYTSNHKTLNIVQQGEVSTLVACARERGEAFVVDEWAARLILEDPFYLKFKLENKLHQKLEIDLNNLSAINSYLSEKPIVLRSAEFALTAWEKGMLGDNKDALVGLLWALKFAGCAITEQEINYYVQRLA
ncbi:MAG: hypothetical protein QW063_00795 [Candidatus Nanoarchaeia archaeon]